MEPADHSGTGLRSGHSREMPALSCRQLAAWITDNRGYRYRSPRSTPRTSVPTRTADAGSRRLISRDSLP